MADKIQLGAGLELWKVSISDLREQDLNARSMPAAMFERLTETINGDKRLEALPFCALTDKALDIVSGHHRIRAAKAAGLSEIFVLVDVTNLTKSQIKAKQLAHNAIAGVDDHSILLEIFAQIESVEDMRESFIDKDALVNLKGITLDEVRMDVENKSVYLTFLPEYFDRWNNLIERQEALVDQIAIAGMSQYEAFHEALKTVGKAYDVKAISPLICKFIELADGLKTEGEWVSIVEIFGARLPKSVADMLRGVIQKAIIQGDITDKNKWQILEYWAADYIAGSDETRQ